MTAEITQATDCLDEALLEDFGEQVFINGVCENAIYNEEDYETESGFVNEITISITAKQARVLKKGDKVLARNIDYVIARIPPLSKHLIDIELKHA